MDSVLDMLLPSWQVVATTIILATVLLPILTPYLQRLFISGKNGAKLPPIAASFLPFFGKAIEMGIDIEGFIRKYSQKLQSKIFQATIAGNPCYFLGDARDITWIFHSNKLEFKFLHIDFMANAAGMNRQTALAMYDHPTLLGDLMKGTTRYILSKNALLETVTEAQIILAKYIDTLSDISTEAFTQVNLLEFVRECVFMASVSPFVSPEMANKECLELFVEFDNGVPLAVAGVPAWCMPKFAKSRATLLEKLISIKSESQLLASRRKTFLSAGFDEATNASSNLSILWAANGNSIPMIFWAIARVLLDTEAHEAVKAEVSKFNTTNLTLDDLDQMTVLNGIFWETSRLSFGGFIPRHVKEDFVHNGHLLQQGTRIMAFTPTIHYSPELFDKPEEFRYDRFVSVEKTGVHIFGGGAHMCPGRKFIQYEFKALACLLFQKLDLRVEPGQTLPGVRPECEGIGVSQPKGDFLVEIRKK